jgi:hypothetical protein
MAVLLPLSRQPYARLLPAIRAGLLPPIVLTDSEIIDGYHRIVLALADKSPTIPAYQPDHQPAAGPIPPGYAPNKPRRST